MQSLQQPAGRIQVANKKGKANVLNLSGTIDPSAWKHGEHLFVAWTELDPNLLTFHHSVAQPSQLRVDVTQQPPDPAFFQSEAKNLQLHNRFGHALHSVGRLSKLYPGCGMGGVVFSKGVFNNDGLNCH